jgi:predicted permease
MKGVRRLARRLAGHVLPRRFDDRIREEMEQHLALQIDENVRAGMPPAEARRQALIKFGGVERVTAEWRDESRLPALDRAGQDLRYAFRQLHRAPVFAIAATLALAAGIGANVAIFTVVDRVMLRRLPVHEPDRLVTIGDQRSQVQQRPVSFPYPLSVALRDSGLLEGVAARSVTAVNVAVGGSALRARGELVSGTYFRVVGTTTRLGRPLTPDDDRTPGAHPVAVVSDRFWRQALESSPAVVGSDLRINTNLFTIVGVAAEPFTGVDPGFPTDIWIPMSMQREVGRNFLTDARSSWLDLMGRLRPEQTADAAAAALTSYVEQHPDLVKSTPPRRFTVTPASGGRSTARRELGPSLQLVMALTGVTLLLECFTLASLLVVRSLARHRERAIRLALGARRSHLVSQTLAETLLIAAIGGAAGLLVAPWVAGVLVASQGTDLSIDPGLDLRVFAFALAVTIVAGLGVGLMPIAAAGRVEGAVAIARAPLRGASGTRRHLLLRDGIVALQIAASLATLITAALLVQSLRALNAIDTGFAADRVLLASMDPGSLGYDARGVEAFWRSVLERVERLPGVRAASLANTIPLAPGRQRQPIVEPASGTAVEIDTNQVGPGYFRTLGLPLVRGREFGDRDNKDSAPVAIVNERFAERWWPGLDPIGRTLRTSRTGPPAEVVGLVKDAKYRDLRQQADAMLYLPLFQTTSTSLKTLHVRVDGEADGFVAAIRREVRALDPGVPLFGVRTIADQYDMFLAQPRQAAALTSAFGVLAMLLAASGVYGVTALAAGAQAREIGIQLALGATPSRIVRRLGSRGGVVVAVGIAAGLLVSAAFTRIASSLLYGIRADDAWTFAVTTLGLTAVSLASVYIPARAGTRLDAARAIRCD